MSVLTKTAFFVILTTILGVNLLRFYHLEQAPAGFYNDEGAAAITSYCLGSQGTDALNNPYPLFGQAGFGSLKPPTQMYLMMAWIKAFGISIQSIRSLEAAAGSVALVGIFFLARFLGGSTCAWLSLLAASISPWGWMVSRFGTETIFAPTFLVWGVFVFLQKPSWWSLPLTAGLFAGAMYSYPPAQLGVPLIILLLIGLQAGQGTSRPIPVLFFLLTLSALCFPLVFNHFYLNPQDRFSQLSIANPEFLRSIGKTSSPLDITLVFFKNYMSHFGKNFLFVTGDTNLRHSTGYVGELSWLDMLAFAAGILLLLLKKIRTTPPAVIFLLLAVAIGIIPSALTNEGQPHALRSIGAWPFMEILAGYCLSKAIARWPMMISLASLTAILFAGTFLFVYFKYWPLYSAGKFKSRIKMSAEQCHTQEDWEHFTSRYYQDRSLVRYYLIRYKGENCSSSLTPYINADDSMNKASAFFF